MKAFFFALCLPILVFAEEADLVKLVQRQAAFGRTIPQEKVFIHLDNTSYQLGDTIWFSAFVRRTDTGKPSDVSGVLYTELYGQDGYMIERKLIQLKEGRGSGFFALSRYIQYAGFYELRAYTRWQLNWGRFEHEHTYMMKQIFSSKQQEKEYFRDYEKLYSRVFPVYDKPLEPGEYSRDMTLRAMRRVYDFDGQKRELKLSLYPEGGNLVEGQPCRVAFEAAFDDGEWPEGWLVYNGDSVKTQNRGRGLFEVVPQKGVERDVLFVTKDGKTAKAKLPKPEQTGVSLSCYRQPPTISPEGESTKPQVSPRGVLEGAVFSFRLHPSPDLPADSLALSLMHEGRLVDWRRFTELVEEGNGRLYSISDSLLAEAGVYQLTVFDTQGRVFADRLFFSRGKETLKPTLSIEGLKEEYEPYEQVNIKLKNSSPLGGGWEGSSFSLSVRDDLNRDFLFDDGNILTEMLLSSEIRGFVPQPGWYFEEDDEEHRQALDLLMMTQGWRRFDWRSMAVAGTWDITQPAERAPILIGSTSKNIITDFVIDAEAAKQERDFEDSFNDDGKNPHDGDGYYEVKPMDLPDLFSQNKSSSRAKTDYKRAIDKQEQEKIKELKVHAEVIAVDAETSFIGEIETYRRAFRIQLPPFYGKSILFLSAADTTKWKKGKPYTWIQAEPDNLDTDFMYLPKSAKLRRKIFVEPADYLPRIIWPYPLFVKPYNYYQKHLAPSPQQKEKSKEWTRLNDETIISEVTIKGKRNTLRRFDDYWPILAIDAERADNMAKDYGIGFVNLMVADYGVEAGDEFVGFGQEATFETRYGFGRTRRMLMGKEIPPDSIYARKYLNSGSFLLTNPATEASGKPGEFGTDAGFQLSPGESLEYKGNGVWDMYVLYSDYSPRMYGSDLYYGANAPKTKLVMYPFPDGSRYMTYRDRRYVLDGFAYPAEFYSPDYSKQELPKDGAGGTDYRRTLYWNPNVKLDENGEAEVKFYNNCRTTQLSVEAEGQSSDGTLLWTK